MKKGGIEIILVIMLLAVSAAFAYYYGTQQSKENNQIPARVSVTPGPISPAPTAAPTPSAVIPAGWLTYTNLTYKFEISYPPGYQAMTDSNNLYGWPNGVVLIYDGGQSYDLAVEHWNSQAEYEAKYKNQSNVTVKKVGSVYITLLNTNFDPEVDKIIETFREN